MNILMNCLSSISGGAVAYLRNLTPLLSERFVASSDGHKLTFLAHKSQTELFSYIPEKECIWIDGARPTGWRRVVWERHNINNIIAKKNTDILFTPYQISPRVKNVKQIMMLRNMEPFLYGKYSYSFSSKLRNYLLRKKSLESLRLADRIIAVSDFVRDYTIAELNINSDRIRRVYHGRSEELSFNCDTDNDLQDLKPYGIKNHFILTCGSLLPYRRCEDVVEAFNQCSEHLPSGTQLVIAGSGTDKGYNKFIRNIIAKSPHNNRIISLGHVPWKIMKELYRQCTICVIATEIEACPNIAIEAMAAGCIIISSDKPPLPEIFGCASVKYKARNIDNMVEQIKKCINDDLLRKQMRLLAQRRSNKFSWEKCSHETYSVLTDWQ